MNKILITGYNGFVGSNLTRSIHASAIYGVDIIHTNSVIRHFKWDELEKCTDANCIIHLAGIAHDTKKTIETQEYININVGLTQKIFQYFLRSTATKFIFFSSVKAVADSLSTEELTEDFTPYPKTPYGISKLEAEKYILNELAKWNEVEMVNGKNTTSKKVYILRPCMIHGPGNKGNLNLLFHFQQKRLPWLFGAFENKRSFCSIGNILFVVQKLIDDNIEPGIYQVADDVPLSTNELIKLIASVQNKKSRIWNIPVPLVKFFSGVGDLLHLPINSERLKKLTESYIVSNQKLKNAIKIKKLPVDSIDGLKLTIKSIQKEFDPTNNQEII